MALERYVLLGLARARSEWFRDVAQWATSGAIPAEFVKCVSAAELRSRLEQGRPFSAALVDGGLPTVDRDVLALIRDAGAVPIVIDDGRVPRDWTALGAVTVLPPTLGRQDLLDVLGMHALKVGRDDTRPTQLTAGEDDAVLGNVAVVCGPGGTGASTVAIALAQGLTTQPRYRSSVLLADFCRHADQAMLHDARDVFPGVQELTEAHRGGRPRPDEVRGLTFEVVERGYHLLLGLRRARYWATVRPRALESAFASLRQSFRMCVFDIDADLEGENEGGSIDVEERNLLSRIPALSADAVFAVGRPGLKGLHALVRLLGELVSVGVDPARIVPVLNTVSRSPKQRAVLTATLSHLAGAATDGAALSSPLFLPPRKVEEALADGVALPAPLPQLLAGAFDATLERAGATQPTAEPEPQQIVPGSLGSLPQEAT